MDVAHTHTHIYIYIYIYIYITRVSSFFTKIYIYKAFLRQKLWTQLFGFHYYCSLIRAFHISDSRWFFTEVWVTASLLKSPGLFLVFWQFSTMLSLLLLLLCIHNYMIISNYSNSVIIMFVHSDIAYSYLILIGGYPCGIETNALGCDIVGSEFEFQLRYYFHFRNNIILKGMNSLIKLRKDSKVNWPLKNVGYLG